jgi:hypothetical protein
LEQTPDEVQNLERLLDDVTNEIQKSW